MRDASHATRGAHRAAATLRHLLRLMPPAWLVAGCASGLPAPVLMPDRSCAQSTVEVLASLRTLDQANEVRADVLGAHARATRTMLRACGAEAASMSAAFADDWRVQSFLIERDLGELAQSGDSTRARFPAHRRRVERLLRMYQAMFSGILMSPSRSSLS